MATVQPSSNQLGPETSPVTGESESFTVLMVDDEPSVRNLVQRLLESRGHRVLLAEDGRVALQRFVEDTPDVVICDVQMPNVDGIQLLQEIRQLSATAEVVMITGFADTDVVISALRSGASNFVEKPFGMVELLAQLAQSFARCRLRREAEQLQDQLDRELKQRELDARMVTMGRLVAGLAHEIQNPVTFLKGNAELVRLLLDRLWQELDLDTEGTLGAAREEIDALLADVEFGTRRIADLVEGMRRYAAPEREPPVAVQLSRLIENSRKFSDNRRGEGVDLVVRHRDPGVYVRVNPVEMESCLVNLLVNAYEALGEGRGEVVVHTALLPYPTQDYDGVVEVVVEDTGPGIPRGVIDEVFTPFFSRKAGGVGLGLSIAFESAKRNGAQMQIESDGESGTRVTVRLPFIRESEGGRDPGRDG